VHTAAGEAHSPLMKYIAYGRMAGSEICAQPHPDPADSVPCRSQALGLNNWEDAGAAGGKACSWSGPVPFWRAAVLFHASMSAGAVAETCIRSTSSNIFCVAKKSKTDVKTPTRIVLKSY
jgi:hypothetical protein